MVLQQCQEWLQTSLFYICRMKHTFCCVLQTFKKINFDDQLDLWQVGRCRLSSFCLSPNTNYKIILLLKRTGIWVLVQFPVMISSRQYVSKVRMKPLISMTTEFLSVPLVNIDHTGDPFGFIVHGSVCLILHTESRIVHLSISYYLYSSLLHTVYSMLCTKTHPIQIMENDTK